MRGLDVALALFTSLIKLLCFSSGFIAYVFSFSEVRICYYPSFWP